FAVAGAGLWLHAARLGTTDRANAASVTAGAGHSFRPALTEVRSRATGSRQETCTRAQYDAQPASSHPTASIRWTLRLCQAALSARDCRQSQHWAVFLARGVQVHLEVQLPAKILVRIDQALSEIPLRVAFLHHQIARASGSWVGAKLGVLL